MASIYDGTFDLEKDWPILWEKFSFVPEDKREAYINKVINFVGRC